MNRRIRIISWLSGSIFLLLTTVSHSQCFSGRAICLPFNQKVVDQNSKCFSQFACGFGGFVCKSDYEKCIKVSNNLQSDYNTLVNDYNALHSNNGDLVDDYNDLRDSYNDLYSSHTALQRKHSDVIEEYNDLVARYNELLD